MGKDVTIWFHRVEKLAVCKHTSFPILIISLKGGFLVFQVEGCLRINVPKINTNTHRYVFTCLYIQYLWKDATKTGNTGWVADKGEGGGGRVEREGGRSQEQRTGGGKKGERNTLFHHLQIEFLTNPKDSVSSLHLPS